MSSGDIIIVTRINRICRNLRDFTSMLEYWDGMDVGFVCADDPVDTSNKSPFGKFIVQLMGAIAELESGLLSERVAESSALRIKQGLPIGTHPPMYYWGRDKKLHVFKPELEAAELFYRQRFDQGMTFHAIWVAARRTHYFRKKKRGNKNYGKEYGITSIIRLIELYRRYLWLTERGVRVFEREYLDATAKGETPMRIHGMVPPELFDGPVVIGGTLSHKTSSSSSNSSV